MKTLIVPAGQRHAENLYAVCAKITVIIWKTGDGEYIAARWLYDHLLHAEIMRAKNDHKSKWHKHEKVWFFTIQDWTAVERIFDFLSANIVDMGAWSDGAWLELAARDQE